jgi:UDP-glucose 4-epimerase
LTGVFNAGYGGQITVLELAQRILALTGSRSPIRFEPARAGDVRHSRAGVERLHQAGFRPTGSLDAGLQHMLSALRSVSNS